MQTFGSPVLVFRLEVPGADGPNRADGAGPTGRNGCMCNRFSLLLLALLAAACAGDSRLRATGACTGPDVPDGGPCDAACGTGTCQAGACVRLEGDVLSLAWSYEAGDETMLTFDGVVDAEGRYYWLDLLDAATTLVSATRDGLVRFRAPLGAVGRGQVAVAGDAAVVSLADGSLEARELADGALRWRRDPPSDLPPPPLNRPPPLLVPGDGTVRLARLSNGRAILLAHDLATGALLAAADLGPAAGEPTAVADERGAIYVGLPGGPAATAGWRNVELLALAPEGAERWRRTVDAPEDGGLPVAVHDGLLLLAPARALDAGSGADRFELPLPGPGSRGGSAAVPILGAFHGFAVDPSTAELVAFDREDGGELGRGALGEGPSPEHGRWQSPLLAGGDRAAVVAGWWTDDTLKERRAQYREFAADGAAVRTCAFPEATIFTGEISLRGDRLAVGWGGNRLFVFALPRGETATGGWAGPAGGPEGGRRAR